MMKQLRDFFSQSHASFIKFNLFFVHFVMEPYNLEKVNPKIRPNAYFPIKDKEGIKWRVENFRPYITIIIFALKSTVFPGYFFHF